MLSPQFYFCFLYIMNNISPARSVFFVRQHLSPLHLPLWQISFLTKKIFTPSLCWTLWKACQSNLNINPCNVLTFATFFMHPFFQTERSATLCTKCTAKLDIAAHSREELQDLFQPQIQDTDSAWLFSVHCLLGPPQKYPKKAHFMKHLYLKHKLFNWPNYRREYQQCLFWHWWQT